MRTQTWFKLPNNTRVELKSSTWEQILENTKKEENWGIFSKKVNIPETTLKSYFYRRSRPTISILKKFVKITSLDPKIIENGIEWNDNLKLLSTSQNKLEDIVVNIDENSYVDLVSLIKGSRVHGYSLTEQFPFKYQILPNDKIRIWYETGGGQYVPKPIEINRFIELNKEIFTCFGLLQAESCKVKGYLTLDFSNCLPFLQKFILDYFEKYWDIYRSLWECEVYYWKGRLTQKIENDLKFFWSKELCISPKKIRIMEGTQYRLSDKASEYGVARLQLNNKTFRTLIMIVLDRIIKPMVEENHEYCGYYLQGLLVGDGSLSLDSSGSLAYVGIAFNPNSDEREHYFKLLDTIGIKINKKTLRKKEIKNIQMTGWWNYLKILQVTENKPFFLDNKRNQKFYKGFLLNQLQDAHGIGFR